MTHGVATWSYVFLMMVVILAPAAFDSQFGVAPGSRPQQEQY